MSRKFVGYVPYAWDNFSIFGQEAETAMCAVVDKTMALAKQYPDLHYKIIKDAPLDAIVFATSAFTEEEGEAWYDCVHTEEEAYVYERLKPLLSQQTKNEHHPHIQDVLRAEIDEYLLETDEAMFIFRYDRILVLSKQHEFEMFSVASDKLYRWFYND